MKRVILGAIALVVVVVALGFLRGFFRQAVRDKMDPLIAAAPKTELPVIAPKVATPAAQAPGAQAAVAPTPAAQPKLSQENQKRLSEIARLDRKAFMSNDEKTFRSNAMKDEQFLKDIAAILGSRDLDAETKREQYQAIDTLLSAQESGSQQANELLKGVVSDSQIENQALAKDVRENLAGIKAEVLYKWRGADEIESLLPGPASRKLWNNVRDQQSRNEAESRTLSH